jgi:ribosomal protein S1
MADVTPSNPEARFKPGQVLKCRVKSVDLAMRRIVLLTAKPGDGRVGAADHHVV